jgi:tetratricopeptide (TPR) repeat protein
MAAPAGGSPIHIVMVGIFGAIGDNVYRQHEPAAALARLGGVEVVEVHPLARYRDAAALAADVLVLSMVMDVEALRLIHQRRLLGKATICEVNDYVPDVQAWNPAHRSWSDRRGLRLFRELVQRSDATQVTSPALAQRLAPQAPQLVVFPNQLASLPPPRQAGPDVAAGEDVPLVVGWGGSIGHLQDLASVAPALCGWLQATPGVRLEIMGDPALAGLFEAAPAERFRFHRAGSLAHYLQWLQGLDIGLAPLLPTDYNRCRSDVKFLEYAAHGVVPVLQRLDPYAHVVEGVTGFLFADSAQMLSVLDRLVVSPALRREVAAAAYGHVACQRRLDDHIGERLAFYRRVQAAVKPVVGPVPEPLRRAGARRLDSLPGLRRVGEHLHHLDLDSPADQKRAAGVEALQAEDLVRAEAAFREAVRLDPGDPHAHAFLGLCHLKQGRPGQAQAALERASALDPLLSRPVRALARLHRQAAKHYGQLACQLNPP